MKPIECNGPAELSGTIEEQLQAISRHQQQAAKSLHAFSRRIRAYPHKTQDNAVQRLRSDCPPGWLIFDNHKQRHIAFHGMNFQEKGRRVDQKIRKLDHINSPLINNDTKLSRFLEEHVVIPFKTQHWLKRFEAGDQSVAVELCGCSKKDGESILDQLEALLDCSIHRLGSESTEENQVSGCGQQVYSLLKEVQKEGLFCAVVAIEASDNNVRALDLFQEIEEQFKKGEHKAIVIVISADDDGRADLEHAEQVARYWLNRLEESKSVIRSLESQTQLVAHLNQVAIDDPDRGPEIARAVVAHKPATGWRIETGQIDKYTQITTMEYQLLNEVLDVIEPLEIDDNKELQSFLNENVVTPFKNQLAFLACGLLKKLNRYILCGSTVDKRQAIVENLESTLLHPIYHFPPQEMDEEEARQKKDPTKLWINNLFEQAKFTNLECFVLAIDVDLLEPHIKVHDLVEGVESKFTWVKKYPIILIMCSTDAALGELPTDIKRFDFDPKAKCSTRDKISWHLHSEIKLCCAENNKDCTDIDWADTVRQLIRDMPKSLVSDEGASKSDIEKACRKKAQEFFSKLMRYCASHGVNQITQDAIKQSCAKPADKKFKKLTKRAEDFTLPGQPELTDFFRTHVIDYLRNPEIYDKFGLAFPPSFLLYGPPGTGKTHAVQQLAEFTNLAFFEMNPSTVGSCYVDECEQNMAEMFEEAKEKNGAIISIDEMDSMLPRRDSLSSHYNIKRTNELLRLIEMAMENRILVIGTTNRISAIDVAALRRGRIGEMFEVKGLTRDNVIELLQARLKDYVDEDESLNLDVVGDIFGMNLMLSDVYAFCQGLRVFAAHRKVDKISQQLLDQYLESQQFSHFQTSGAAAKHAAADSADHRLLDALKTADFGKLRS